MSNARRARPRPDAPETSAAPTDAAPDGALTKMLQVQRKLWKAGVETVTRATSSEPIHDGMRKLEQVFDDRVAEALQRLDMPSAAEYRELLERVAALERAAKSTERRPVKRKAVDRQSVEQKRR